MNASLSITKVVVVGNADIRSMVINYLGAKDFAMCGTASGDELDQALAEQPADMLIVDLNLPLKDGYLDSEPPRVF